MRAAGGAADKPRHPSPPPARHPSPCRSSFACARTLHAGFPSAFLWLERFQWALAGLIDDTRPMDMMPLSFATPAEDEIATSALTGGWELAEEWGLGRRARGAAAAWRVRPRLR